MIRSQPGVVFLDVGAAYEELRPQIDGAIRRVMESGWFILGEEVEAFESEFAAFCGARQCVGVANGLDALQLILRGYRIGAGDEVLVPAHTFIATWLAVTHAGACPVPVEVDPATGNIDPAAVRAAISGRTRAVIAVHLYGQPADLGGLRDATSGHGLLLLEDAAQAHGAALGRARTGSLGDAAAFSFYPGKNLGAYGDGGAITTDDESLASRLRALRNYGSTRKYFHETCGINSRLDPLQAAVLRVKLAVLDEWNARRRRIARVYQERLGGAHVCAIPPDVPHTTSAWHLFVIRHGARQALADALAARGVPTQIHYPVPPHLSPAYAHLGYGRGAFPIAERLAETVLSLPIGPHLRHAGAALVADATIDAAASVRAAS